MNTLTVNLHLMMVSFYRPTAGATASSSRRSAFPSDRYAFASQVRFHGFDPAEALVPLAPRPGEDLLRPEDLLEAIERQGERLALVLLGNVNYLTGQAFDVAAITRAGHGVGATRGLRPRPRRRKSRLPAPRRRAGLRGLVLVQVPQRRARERSAGSSCTRATAEARGLPRFEGWWGHDEASRFEMGPRFEAMPGAEGWQLSNPPILSLAALRASMELFDAVGMTALRRKSERLTGLMDQLVRGMPGVEVITPADPAQRGAQLSLRIGRDARGLVQRLAAAGRGLRLPGAGHRPRRARALLHPFVDVVRFAEVLRSHVQG